MKLFISQFNEQLNALNTELQRQVKKWVNEMTEQSNPSKLEQFKIAGALKLVTQFVGQAIPFASRNGFKVIDFKPGYVKAFMPLKGNKNHFNAMYAGALFTVAELPGGIISVFNFDERFYPVLKDLKMDFLKMAKTDVTVAFQLDASELKRLQNETLEQGKAEFMLEGEVTDANGQVVARSLAHYQVRMH